MQHFSTTSENAFVHDNLQIQDSRGFFNTLA